MRRPSSRSTRLKAVPRGLPFLFLTLLGACSPAEGDASSSQDALRNGGICATLDYGHTKSNADFYGQFKDDAAAADYVTNLIGAGALAAISGADAKFKELSADARLVKLVGEVYGAYQRVFPKETEGMPNAPRIAIVESSNVNAFALGPGIEAGGVRKDQSPWIFIVHTALLSASHTDNELRGLFAHELGHLILRTFLPEIQERLRSTYMLKGSEDGILGASADNEPGVAAHVEETLKRQQRIGGLPELGPSFSSLGGSYATVVGAMFGQPEAGTAECAAAATQITQLTSLQTALLPDLSGGLFVPRRPTPDEQSKLDAVSASVDKGLRACFAKGVAGAPTSLLELTAGLNDLSDQAGDPTNPDHAKALALMLDAERQVDAAAPAGDPLIDRLLDAATRLRKEELALREDPSFPIGQIRTFDYEEDADDASARILAALGDDPKGVGHFLLSMLPKAAADACVRDVAAGKAIPYGQFVDTHPATCWRYYHVTQFSKTLAQCAGTSDGKGQMKGSGEPSVFDAMGRARDQKGPGTGEK
jgi:hypothetical protein